MCWTSFYCFTFFSIKRNLNSGVFLSAAVCSILVCTLNRELQAHQWEHLNASSHFIINLTVHCLLKSWGNNSFHFICWYPGYVAHIAHLTWASDINKELKNREINESFFEKGGSAFPLFFLLQSNQLAISFKVCLKSSEQHNTFD